MKQVSLFVLLLALAALAAYVFGIKMHSGNPEGIWLSTPPADGSGNPSDAFYVGAFIGLILISLSYLAVSVSVYSWSKLKPTKLPHVFLPLISASIVSMVAIVALKQIAL